MPSGPYRSHFTLKWPPDGDGIAPARAFRATALSRVWFRSVKSCRCRAWIGLSTQKKSLNVSCWLLFRGVNLRQCHRWQSFRHLHRRRPTLSLYIALWQQEPETMGTELADVLCITRKWSRGHVWQKLLLQSRDTVCKRGAAAVLSGKVSALSPITQPLSLEPARSTRSLPGFSFGASLRPNQTTKNTGAAFSSRDFKWFKEAKKRALRGYTKRNYTSRRMEGEFQ